jgi:hypothetical protein
MERIMNKVIAAALFTVRDAREQRIRARRSVDAVPHPEDVSDVRRIENSWDRAAKGFRAHDPGGTKVGALLRKARR